MSLEIFMWMKAFSENRLKTIPKISSRNYFQIATGRQAEQVRLRGIPLHELRVPSGAQGVY